MTRIDIAESLFATALLALAGLVLASSGVFAAERLTSAYTRFDAASCRHSKGSDAEDYGSWRCKGYKDIPVLLSAGDQRMFVTFGKSSPENLAESETFPSFNDAYEGTVEWRLAAGQAEPFATVLRWNVMRTADETFTGSRQPAKARVLVVTRLGPGGICHVGYVDVDANANTANALARQIADERARDFRCGVDKARALGAVTVDLALP
jgi:hypothetical protein